MNILLTNDDGIAAPGLWAAARALASLGQVLVVAPSANWSGYGAALPPVAELAYAPFAVAADLADRVTAFSVDGTPAACAQVGLSGALSTRSIDLVVSGINAGLNVGPRCVLLRHGRRGHHRTADGQSPQLRFAGKRQQRRAALRNRRGLPG